MGRGGGGGGVRKQERACTMLEQVGCGKGGGGEIKLLGSTDLEEQGNPGLKQVLST